MTSAAISSAAAAIVNLINTSPRTPSADEIARTLEMSIAKAEPSAILAEVRRLRREVEAAQAAEMAANVSCQEMEVNDYARGLEEKFKALSLAVWASPVRTFDDVLARVEIELYNSLDVNEDGQIVAIDARLLCDNFKLDDASHDLRSPTELLAALAQWTDRLESRTGPTRPASPLTTELRRARPVLYAAVAEECDAEKTPAYEAASAKARRLDDQFESLCRQVWKRPVDNCNRDDLAMRCEAALR